MTTLKHSADAWGTERFAAVLKDELEQLRADVLPIAHVLEPDDRLDDSDLGVIVNEVSDDAQHIFAKVGVFFAKFVECTTCGGGSGMHDEAYCELLVTIDRSSGKASFEPL